MSERLSLTINVRSDVSACHSQRFGAAMFTRHGGAGGVDDIGFDASRPQPTCLSA